MLSYNCHLFINERLLGVYTSDISILENEISTILLLLKNAPLLYLSPDDYSYYVNALLSFLSSDQLVLQICFNDSLK